MDGRADYEQRPYDADEDEKLLDEDDLRTPRARKRRCARWCNLSALWWSSNIILLGLVAWLCFQLDYIDQLTHRYQ